MKQSKGEKQLYRLNMKLRRRGSAAMDQNRYELKSEDYDSDEEFCFAVASELMGLITSDRDAIDEQDADDEEDGEL
jgi:hypothetical protein